MQGIRGAITVGENKKEIIFEAVQDLLNQLVEKNDLALSDIGAAIFSATPDLNAAFPAAAARKIGWNLVPLFGTQELDVENGLDMCVRVLLLVNTDKKQEEIAHVYLGESNCLRPDLAKNILD
ncbi:chorismate mutase [Anaerosinus gibii]|uniref:chorismate mutase n=1 Tax=Selenobaculum gibii TaxID=3054208 RepID=A0A9Y2AFM6_9FIRM|nr:chorismate mutase [Selenobaculum gbiensis]WIW69954.1 chorismate mutase [Selenobaculum gbiensis]